MTVYLLTKNAGKIRAAVSVFDGYGITVKNIEKEYPEIQADRSIEIARYGALEAAKEHNVSVVREDHSLFIHALGIPGPYTSYIEKHVSVEKLLSLLQNEQDRIGHFELALAYAEPDGQIKEFVYSVPIHIKEEIEVKDPRGGWNSILCLESESRAFTEYAEEERIDVWNKNYRDLAEFLRKREAQK